ncbi:MAG: hypothetical protein RDU76_02855 [Candidatus Edwardsbacteria bacterium]|nr:hypothetical protein [Candidatus Edwardsbacteria bacterium]
MEYILILIVLVVVVLVNVKKDKGNAVDKSSYNNPGRCSVCGTEYYSVCPNGCMNKDKNVIPVSSKRNEIVAPVNNNLKYCPLCGLKQTRGNTTKCRKCGYAFGKAPKQKSQMPLLADASASQRINGIVNKTPQKADSFDFIEKCLCKTCERTFITGPINYYLKAEIPCPDCGGEDFINESYLRMKCPGCKKIIEFHEDTYNALYDTHVCPSCRTSFTMH